MALHVVARLALVNRAPAPRNMRRLPEQGLPRRWVLAIAIGDKVWAQTRSAAIPKTTRHLEFHSVEHQNQQSHISSIPRVRVLRQPKLWPIEPTTRDHATSPPKPPPACIRLPPRRAAATPFVPAWTQRYVRGRSSAAGVGVSEAPLRERRGPPARTVSAPRACRCGRAGTRGARSATRLV